MGAVALFVSMAETVPNKTGTKTAKPGTFVKGDDKRRGGGKKGRSGRKPNNFVAMCNTMADTYVIEEAEKILQTGSEHPDFKWASEYVSKYSKSPAPTKTEFAIPEPLTIRVVHE